jgi:hypothetical protein
MTPLSYLFPYRYRQPHWLRGSSVVNAHGGKQCPVLSAASSEGSGGKGGSAGGTDHTPPAPS